MARKIQLVENWSETTIINRFAQLAKVQGFKAKDYSQQEKIDMLKNVFDDAEKRKEQEAAFAKINENKIKPKAEVIIDKIDENIKQLKKEIKIEINSFSLDKINSYLFQIEEITSLLTSSISESKIREKEKIRKEIEELNNRLNELD